jgi:type II secretory pathway component GspD/PulD (secretin)
MEAFITHHFSGSGLTMNSQWKSRTGFVGILTLFCLGLIVSFSSSPLQAQPPGSGRPSFRGFSPGLMGALLREETQKELKLSDDQVDKALDIADKYRPQREDMQPFMDRMRDAKTDEERTKIRDEMKSMMEKKAKKSDEEIKKLIGKDKVERLGQLSVQFEGHRALLSPDIMKKLNLSDSQQEKILKIMEERSEARRDLGFRASDEERLAFDREWNAKIFAVLTPEQRQMWQQIVGSVVVDNGTPGSKSAKFNGATGSLAGKQQDAKTDINSEMIRPDGPGEGPLASFGNVAEAEPVARPYDDQPLQAPAASESEKRTETTSPEPEEATKTATELPKQDGSVGFGGLEQSETKKVSFNFRYAPWADVLKMFSELAGLTIDLNVTPPGTFNYYDAKEYTPLEALDVLNGYLLQKGYLLVRRNQFLVVLNIDEGIPPNLIPNVALDELKNRGKNEIMRIRVPLAGIEADQAAREVEALLGPQGNVVPLRTSNSLLITDIGDNLMAIAQLLESVTTEEDPKEVIFQQFTLKNMAASDGESMVREQFGISKVLPNVAAFTGSDSRRSSSSQTAPANTSGLNITSDNRTNSLLVTAPRATMKLIEDLIKAIDVGDGTITQTGDTGEPYLKVYLVQNADAREITKTINALRPGVVVNEDGKSRRVHIVATETEHEEIGQMIKELDGEGGDTAVSVLYLSRLDPIGAAATLDSLFIGDGDLAPIIQADAFGRRLLIRGTHEQLTQVKAVLAQLGEDGTEKASESGPVISIPLGGRNAADMLRLLQQNWEAQQPNPIRIVVPGARNPVKGEYVPSKPGNEDETSEDVSDKRPADKADSFTAQMYRELEVLVRQKEGSSVDQVLQEMDEELQEVINNQEPVLDLTPASQRPAEPDAPKADLVDELDRRLGNVMEPQVSDEKSSDPVFVTIQGDNLVIGSDDSEAINKLKDLVQAIGMAMPPEKNWTLFYLQSTDATEVAYMLEQLIPDSSVSSSSSGNDGSIMGSLMGLGQQMADVSGLSSAVENSTSLRIIPETRLNALFVTGPNYLVAEVEQFLKVLDASELPDSLRDRLPRQIPVEHADVNEVYNIVSDVYKDYLSSGRSQNGNNAVNPFAAMMGGQNTNTAPQLAKLTLGVDERTSQLIVSAGDSLFREIEQLVGSVDQSAKDANKTVRVVRLESADPILVQQTLQSLLPKVKVSATGTERKANNSKNDQGERDRGKDDAERQADQMRKMMEQRMRERMQQGGGGGQDAGARSRLFSPGGSGQRGGARGGR